MTLNYQLESSHVADYQLYSLSDVSFTLRGPQPPLRGNSPVLSFLGAAQTFGAFVKYPYPNLLGDMCSARVLNFGRGGAGPGFYLEQQAVLDYVNRTDCCVVQVMSARSSVNNAFMESVGGLTSVRIKQGRLKGETLLGHIAYKELEKELDTSSFIRLIHETQEHYVEQNIQLSRQISCPKILLYVGTNAPIKPGLKSKVAPGRFLVGAHPHMVTEEMLEQLAPHFDAVVYAHDDKGARNRLLNRFTGDFVSLSRPSGLTVTSHSAYISPYLHVSAAQALYDPVMQALSRRVDSSRGQPLK